MANLDWKNLGFQFLPTRAWVKSEYSGDSWGSLKVETGSPEIKTHLASNVLQYGQACFEGLKAFRTKKGDVVLFRPDQNGKRLENSAKRLCMKAPSVDLFIEACRLAVRENMEFVPPYGTGASLYLRPTLIGTQPTIGVNPSETYLFYVLVTPVGPYYKNGFFPVNAVVLDEFDRAAPRGTGFAKAAGNYAASLLPGIVAKQKGYPIVLFTDPVQHKFVDEFGTSNFIGITPEKEYITPDSESILPSITNASLQILAEDEGLKVRREPVAMERLNRFTEVGACGTAAVITPVYSITMGEKKWTFGEKEKAGSTLTLLYNSLQSVQYGEREDTRGWLVIV